MFKLSKLNEKYADTCEQCESEETPVFHLQGTNQNLDTFLCTSCLDKLKNTFANFEGGK